MLDAGQRAERAIRQLCAASGKSWLSALFPAVNRMVACSAPPHNVLHNVLRRSTVCFVCSDLL